MDKLFVNSYNASKYVSLDWVNWLNSEDFNEIFYQKYSAD